VNTTVKLVISATAKWRLKTWTRDSYHVHRKQYGGRTEASVRASLMSF